MEDERQETQKLRMSVDWLVAMKCATDGRRTVLIASEFSS